MQQEMMDKTLMDARLLGIFKSICDKNSSSSNRKRLQNILALTNNKQETIKLIVDREYGISIDNYSANKLIELLDAFFSKSSFRKKVEQGMKKKLLIDQNNRCAICNCDISNEYHLDHIIPFKYVGDCLENNWQLLSTHCNEKKGASIDYEIKYLLNLV